MRLLQNLIDAQDDTCIHCGRPLAMINPATGKDYYENHKLRPTFDHVVPKSKTRRHKGNLLAAHRICNNEKGDRDPTGCELIWLEVVNARTGRAHQEAIEARIRQWRKLVDEQEQLSYSDSDSNESKETQSCLWDSTKKNSNFATARA